MARTIQSPGVEINEIDLSTTAQLPVGTNVYVQGFTSSGPSQEILTISSLDEFERIYGLPSSAAERYAYITARQVINSPGNLIFNRLPYGEDEGDGVDTGYTLLAFPFTATATASSVSAMSAVSAIDLKDSDAYSQITLTEPTMIPISQTEYEKIKSGDLSWTDTASASAFSSITEFDDIGGSALVIINSNKHSILEDFSGYYISVNDNVNADANTFSSVTDINTRLNSNWISLSGAGQSITMPLTSAGSTASVSQIVDESVGFRFDDSAYSDMLKISLFRLRPDFVNTNNQRQSPQLGVFFRGTFLGSLAERRVGTELTPFDPVPRTLFIENTVASATNNLEVLVNPYLANTFTNKKVRTNGLDKLYALGEYKPCSDPKFRDVGNVTAKLERGLRLIENRDLLPVDIIVDGGISTISMGFSGSSGNSFDDTVDIDVTDAAAQQRWFGVYNALRESAEDIRRDCMFIVDPPRHIFVKGRDTKTLSLKSKSFFQDILTPLRDTADNCNTSYGALYSNWVKVLNTSDNRMVWAPFSGFQAAIMSRVDATFFPWYAPAGLNNGVIRGIVDIAITPNQRERDQLYRLNFNPVTNFPGDGFVVFGQKTLQTRPSALDRINVRRLFLVLQRATRRVARYFVFEPNTIFTRTRLVNVLTPIFENAKNNQGVYDYLIVCDERNNTPDVIDRNELVVDIYIKPVRASEFILVNFIATRTGDDFSELIG